MLTRYPHKLTRYFRRQLSSGRPTDGRWTWWDVFKAIKRLLFFFWPPQFSACVVDVLRAVVTLRWRERPYQWWARHRGSAAVRGPLSVGRQQPASAPCQQINSSQTIITFHTQIFSEVREEHDRPVRACVECVKTIRGIASTKGMRL